MEERKGNRDMVKKAKAKQGSGIGGESQYKAGKGREKRGAREEKSMARKVRGNRGARQRRGKERKAREG